MIPRANSEDITEFVSGTSGDGFYSWLMGFGRIPYLPLSLLETSSDKGNK